MTVQNIHIDDSGATHPGQEEFFGQFGEDFLLWNFFGRKPTGFFLEVGAFDGIFLSPSYWFERNGWRGICVEPHPDYFPLCRKNRSESLCVHAACVGNEDVKRIELFAEPSGLFSVLGESNEEIMKQRFVDAWGKNLHGVHKVEVPALTINGLLGHHLPEGVKIDFVSIDVEGAEVEVLKGFDLNKYSPRVLIVETNSDTERDEVSTHLAPFGYREARRLYVNTLYVKTEEDAQRLRSILLEYKTARRLHPAGASFTPLAQKTGEYRSERGALLQQWIAELAQQKDEIETLRSSLSSLRTQVEEKEHEIRSLKSVADERLAQMIQKEEVIQNLAASQHRGKETVIDRILDFLRGSGR